MYAYSSFVCMYALSMNNVYAVTTESLDPLGTGVKDSSRLLGTGNPIQALWKGSQCSSPRGIPPATDTNYLNVHLRKHFNVLTSFLRVITNTKIKHIPKY